MVVVLIFICCVVALLRVYSILRISSSVRLSLPAVYLRLLHACLGVSLPDVIGVSVEGSFTWRLHRVACLIEPSGVSSIFPLYSSCFFSFLSVGSVGTCLSCQDGAASWGVLTAVVHSHAKCKERRRKSEWIRRFAGVSSPALSLSFSLSFFSRINKE